ncbi:hypothetical protein C8Q80DRAFT_356633 [Daedaleopsis nitida]|nr:hypothetical protein C8Q80DRAFT_356633 [Daedaleopsis nitida]
MTAVHPAGSYKEPILVSDEEDAAFVENELSRWTDSSNSSSNSPTYSPTQNAYTPSYFTAASPRPNSPVPPAPAPTPSASTPAIAASISGQKRKWTDMRDPSSSSSTIPPQPSHDHHSGTKKKKKQRKERQRNAAAASSSTADAHKSTQRKAKPIKTFQDGSTAPQPFEYPTPPYSLQLPYDYQGFEQGLGMAYGMGMGWPMGQVPMVSPTFLSPEDEYRPTDGPLWNTSEHPSALSALAPAWYPPSAMSYHPEGDLSLQVPSGPLARAPPPPADPDPPVQMLPPAFVSQPPPSPSEPPPTDFSTLFQQPFDSSLSERLRQLEALSASLMALAGSSSTLPAPAESPMRSSFSIPSLSPKTESRQELPPVQKRHESPRIRKLPEPPARPPTEPLKRLIGVPEDKGNNGYFDLKAQHLDPPAPSAPIPPVADFTLVMAQLPKRFRKTDFVTSWAKRYGTPVRVVLDPKAGKALVEWVGSQAVEHAFTGPRLRGDGKEHIRVYRYRGAKPLPATTGHSEQAIQVKQEVEDGEIEEGEVVEMDTKSKKKKKNKGKKKAQPAASPVPAPLVHPLPPPPHLPAPANPALVASSSAIPIVSPVAPEHRRPLEERFSDPPLARSAREGTGEEEEMELESDDEVARPSPAAPLFVADQTSLEEDMDLEDDEDDTSARDADVEDADVDMEMSSVAEGTPPPVFKVEASTPQAIDVGVPSAVPQDADPIHEMVPPDPAVVPHLRERDGVAVRDARRQKLEEAIARTKAELAMRAAATSSRTSLVSSTGTSESPEPATPLDSPIWDHAQVAVATGSQTEAIVSENRRSAVDVATSVVIKTEATIVNLDDLASSFISETIHAAATAPQTPSPSSPTYIDSPMLPHQIPPGPAVPITVAVPVPVPAPARTTTSVTITLSEEQKQQKQKRWLELVSASRTLFGKIASANTKEEKDLLMRLLRAKTK